MADCFVICAGLSRVVLKKKAFPDQAENQRGEQHDMAWQPWTFCFSGLVSVRPQHFFLIACTHFTNHTRMLFRDFRFRRWIFRDHNTEELYTLIKTKQKQRNTIGRSTARMCSSLKCLKKVYRIGGPCQKRHGIWNSESGKDWQEDCRIWSHSEHFETGAKQKRESIISLSCVRLAAS